MPILRHNRIILLILSKFIITVLIRVLKYRDAEAEPLEVTSFGINPCLKIIFAFLPYTKSPV